MDFAILVVFTALYYVLQGFGVFTVPTPWNWLVAAILGICIGYLMGRLPK